MNALSKTLSFIETSGNKLPHPTVLFIYLCGIVALLSALFAALGASSIHPLTKEVVAAKNIISVDGLHYVLKNTVSNFVNFAPVGSVLLAILGIGIAEHSGLIGSVLRRTVLNAPPKLTTFFVVCASVLSSIALDTGYVVLIPLSGLIFYSMGRNPITGIVASFAGVSGGFSANIIIGPVDAVLAGISSEAVQLVSPEYHVSTAANYYFIAISTLLIGIVGTFVTEKIVAPRVPDPEKTNVEEFTSIEGEQQALRVVGIFTLIFVLCILWGLVPENGILRDPESGGILSSPFMKGIVVIISIYAALAGCIFAKVSKQTWKQSFIVEAMEKHMQTMAGYLVLMFFAAQFVNYFGWSQLGTIFAIQGADLLSALDLPKALILFLFILLAASLNLFVGSASAKWALIAPIFIPMFFLNGISPEATQMAYRIGDSTTNIITPLMPYFGVVVAFAQRYKPDIGLGSLISMMIPYSLAFLFSWTLLLLVWIGFNLPLGPNAGIFVP